MLVHPPCLEYTTSRPSPFAHPSCLPIASKYSILSPLVGYKKIEAVSSYPYNHPQGLVVPFSFWYHRYVRGRETERDRKEKKVRKFCKFMYTNNTRTYGKTPHLPSVIPRGSRNVPHRQIEEEKSSKRRRKNNARENIPPVQPPTHLGPSK